MDKIYLKTLKTQIKRRTSEKEIHLSFRGTVILFILLSVSGDQIKKVTMFFSIFFGRFPGNRWLYHLTRTQHETTSNYDAPFGSLPQALLEIPWRHLVSVCVTTIGDAPTPATV
jgi:hypothetical protein